MTKRLVDRLGRQEIQLSISRAAEDVIAKDGYDPENGARPLRRAIQRDLEDPIASALVSGEAKAGQKIKVGSHRGQLKFDWGAPEKVKA
jgi:ATP-dependent Clp protease ATP-binding subunit ClpC